MKDELADAEERCAGCGRRHVEHGWRGGVFWCETGSCFTPITVRAQSIPAQALRSQPSVEAWRPIGEKPQAVGTVAWQTVDAWIRASESLGCAEFAVQNVSDLHRLRDEIAALEQVIQQRDEAVRHLRAMSHVCPKPGEVEEALAFLAALAQPLYEGKGG